MSRPTTRRIAPYGVAAAVVVFVAAPSPVEARGAHAFDLVSHSSLGDPGDGPSRLAVVSADGRYVAFESRANDLVVGDSGAGLDVFRWDANADQMIAVSRASAGGPPDGPSSSAAISASGRYVVYASTATDIAGPADDGTVDIFRYDAVADATILITHPKNRNGGYTGAAEPSLSGNGTLVAFTSGSVGFAPHDTNHAKDVFVYDVAARHTTRISLGASGQQRRGDSYAPAISRDGRFVTYTHDGGPSHRQIIRYDLQTGRSILVSRNAIGRRGDRDSDASAISGGGRYVVYRSLARNLAAHDAKRRIDVFLFDAQTETTSLISRAEGGGPANGPSGRPDISDDGDHIVFESTATNLSADRTGGEKNVFEHYVPSGITVLYSEALGPGGPNGPSLAPAISASGFAVAFSSAASNIVAGDTSGIDVFRRTLG